MLQPIMCARGMYASNATQEVRILLRLSFRVARVGR
jgi:hypothetical protein